MGQDIERLSIATGGNGADHPSGEALRESEARLRAIFEAAVNAIITIDEHGVMESVNAAAERIFGYAAEEMIGRNITMLMPAPYCDEHDAYLARYARTGEAKIIGIGRETVAQRKGGEVFPVDLSVSEVHLPHKRLYTGIVRDITERKRQETELRQYRERLEIMVQEALAEVHTLSGLLPICASCKNIRDDRGYWLQIEQYISQHSDASFSHSLCPECAAELYPDVSPGKDAQARRSPGATGQPGGG